MKIRSLIFICALATLSSCGRRHPGTIINNTNETLQVFFKLNYPPTDYCPDNYFREHLFYSLKFNDPGNYVMRFDSIKNTAYIMLKPEQVTKLGTVRVGGGDRNDWRSWEFTEIKCIGDKGYSMHAKNKEIMDFVDKPLLFSTFDFIIQ